MVASYSWHPGAGPVEPVWPLSKPLLADELLTSWIARVALAHGCCPTALIASAWRGFRGRTGDLDRGVSASRLAVLSKQSGVPYASLQSATLAHVMPSIMRLPDRLPRGNWPWITVLGCRGNHHSGGLQCCPDCIAQYNSRYLIQWRLAWHTCCPVHGVLLVEQCGRCLAPLQPELLKVGASFNDCHRCGAPLSDNTRSAFVEAALAFQRFVDEGIGRHPMYGTLPLDFRDWLTVARTMVSFAQAALRHHSVAAVRFFESLGIALETLHPVSLGLPLEYLAPAERAVLLSIVWVIMSAGPDRFIEVARRESLPASTLHIPLNGAPPVLLELAAALQAPRHHLAGGVGCGHPSSPARTLRMWLRLKRKVRRRGIR
ncbi:TniQ family protein [Pseudomonas sp. B21-009]|uniref:TniQ family protein n=1 Tax=Pseudomonas sp. B21-009 TaxID=2895470 RepID=UPI0038D48863